MKKIILGLVATSLFTTQASAESWICMADQATGFSFDESSNKWVQAKFNVSETKYVISQSEEPKWQFVVREVGNPGPLPRAWCKEGFTEAFLQCEGLFGGFNFNKMNLRFVHSYTAGYIEFVPGNSLNMKEGDDTPLVEIGRCSKL